MSWQDIMPTQGALSDLLRKLQVKGVEVNINACATSAILSIIMNCPEVDIGPLLSELKEQTKDLSPVQKGLRINSNEAMRTAHNSLTNMIASRSNSVEQTGYNFVSYLPMDGVLYELDGQKLGPISLGTYSGRRTDGLWLEMALPLIKEQVVKYRKNRCRWTLLAVIEKGGELYRTQLEELLKRAHQLRQQHPASPAREREMREVKQRCQHVLTKHQSAIRHITWAKAYSYLKHDYIPFAINLLKLLAEKNKLKPLIADAMRKKSQMQAKLK